MMSYLRGERDRWSGIAISRLIAQIDMRKVQFETHREVKIERGHHLAVYCDKT